MSSNTSLHSNAFNFIDFLNTLVDPRTGQFTTSISLPELKANNLCGPVVPLSLFFNALNNQDSGFGIGWNLQLSQFNPNSGMLALFTGESFKVLLGGPLPEIPEQKLVSFHFHEITYNNRPAYRIDHKNGLVEILQVDKGSLALPVEMRSPQGHHVTLTYQSFGTEPLLGSIANADGSLLLSLARTTNQMKLTLHPGSPFEAVFGMNISGGETRSLVLPTDDLASWRFQYIPLEGLTCLEQVWTPTGGHHKVTYSGQPHAFPGLANRKLPRVETSVRNPGGGQQAIESHYAYSNSGANFLGLGSGVTHSDDGLDNLNKDGVMRNYQYETTETLWDAPGKKAVRTIRRVYNRAHLQELEETTQYSDDPKKDHAYYKTESEYYFDPNLDFKDQQTYFQLPKSVTQTWHYRSATHPRHEETTTTTYDTWGNLRTQVNPNGVIETSEWYPAAGESDASGVLCPKDPQDFVRNLKSKTVTPAPSPYGNAPTLKTRYRYASYQGLKGAGTWLALRDETIFELVNGTARTELRQIAHEYFDTPLDIVRHGLISKTEQTLHGQTATRNTTEYTYQQTPAGALRTVSTLIGFDDTAKTPVRSVITREHSLLSGWKLSSKDDDDSQVLYTHDKLGRVTEETAAPNTLYVAKRIYSYSLTNGSVPNQQAMQSVTDAKGVETRTWLDGFNRVVKEEKQDVEAWAGNPAAFRPIYKAIYDNREQKVSETTVDWDGPKDLPSTHTFEYNAWGEEYKVTGPDGVVQVTDNNPTTQVLESWIESSILPIQTSGRTRTRLNRFGKEDSIEKIDAKGNVVSTTLYRYDGLGNCVEKDDEMGETTRFAYDLFDRLHATTLPDGVVIRRTYADHSPGELATEISVALDASDPTPIIVGAQKHDGLGRRTRLQVGPRVQQFKYLGGQSLVSEMITASNQTITYEYTPGLVGSPVGSIAPDEQSSFNYDAQSAQLTSSSNTQGENGFDYNFAGQLRLETWKDKRSGKNGNTAYTHTLNGRLLTRLDSNGLLCTYTYDDPTSRILSISQGDLLASFQYNDLGQTHVVTTRNKSTGQEQKTTVTFDELGREISRLIELDGHLEQLISQTYRADSKLKTRHLQSTVQPAPWQTELLETFDYDSRGRLVDYTCQGPALPQDRYGNGIKHQVYTFGPLDNITYRYTLFADGRQDDAYTTYSNQDPCQPVQVTHNHPDYPARVSLNYDLDGNLLQDERGQPLEYDTQGRLLKVTSADGPLVSQYRYDAHHHLLGVTRGTQPETLRFYQGQRLSRTEQGSKKIHYLYGSGQPLGQQEQGLPANTLLLMADGKNTVLAESGQNQLRKAVYGAYGELNPNHNLECDLGFNGEVRDEHSGWYLLGKGYRAYNPELMCFHSPDSLSPFGAGGINCYMYCAGDPINSTDPTGHKKRDTNWKGIQGILLGIAGIALSVAAIIIAPPVSVLGVAATVGFESVGVAFAAIGISDGIKANQSRSDEERDRYASSSFTSGLFDVGFGAFGIFMAYRAVSKVVGRTATEAGQGAAATRSSLKVTSETIKPPVTPRKKAGWPVYRPSEQVDSNWARHANSSFYDGLTLNLPDMGKTATNNPTSATYPGVDFDNFLLTLGTDVNPLTKPPVEVDMEILVSARKIGPDWSFGADQAASRMPTHEVVGIRNLFRS